MFKKRSWTRVSSVSSGWKAATRSRPSRASTGWPSTSASTSTSGPTSSSHGARIKTARSGSPPREPGRADKDGAQRLLAVSDVEVSLETPHLPAERVASRPVVAEAEVVAVENDHPGARAEDRAVEPPHCVVEVVELHEPADCGRLAAGNDQPVESVEVVREPHLDRFGTEPPQHGSVLPEVPLHGEDADPERLLHCLRW